MCFQLYLGFRLASCIKQASLNSRSSPGEKLLWSFFVTKPRVEIAAFSMETSSELAREGEL